MAGIGDTVRVESGRLVGRLEPDGTVLSFKGIPYARPPLGALRWRPPLAPEPRDGIRAAGHFAPRCVQPERPATAIGSFAPERDSEDCLYLNVWTEAAADDEARPVMVWFHGGGYAVGSGAVPLFAGAKLARKGVVVVTVNYRLGRLGFLAHPELSRECDARTSGNYGLLDQFAALRWVQQNIASFGGDPGRVTVFGQSAGATSIQCMMASPLAKGTFQRAIGQSGGALGQRALVPLDAAERAGRELARALGASSIATLRALPAREEFNSCGRTRAEGSRKCMRFLRSRRVGPGNLMGGDRRACAAGTGPRRLRARRPVRRAASHRLDPRRRLDAAA